VKPLHNLTAGRTPQSHTPEVQPLDAPEHDPRTTRLFPETGPPSCRALIDGQPRCARREGPAVRFSRAWCIDFGPGRESLGMWSGARGADSKEESSSKPALDALPPGRASYKSDSRQRRRESQLRDGGRPDQCRHTHDRTQQDRSAKAPREQVGAGGNSTQRRQGVQGNHPCVLSRAIRPQHATPVLGRRAARARQPGENSGDLYELGGGPDLDDTYSWAQASLWQSAAEAARSRQTGKGTKRLSSRYQVWTHAPRYC